MLGLFSQPLFFYISVLFKLGRIQASQIVKSGNVHTSLKPEDILGLIVY